MSKSVPTRRASRGEEGMKMKPCSKVWLAVAFAVGWLVAHFAYRQVDIFEDKEWLNKITRFVTVKTSTIYSFPITQLTQFRTTPMQERDGYRKGYEQGYRDGCAVREGGKP